MFYYEQSIKQTLIQARFMLLRKVLYQTDPGDICMGISGTKPALAVVLVCAPSRRLLQDTELLCAITF